MSVFDDIKDITKQNEDYFKKLGSVSNKASDRTKSEAYWENIRAQVACIGSVGSNGKKVGIRPEIRNIIVKEFETVLFMGRDYFTAYNKCDHAGMAAAVIKQHSDVSGRLKKVGLTKLGYSAQLLKDGATPYSVALVNKDGKVLARTEYEDTNGQYSQAYNAGQKIIDDINSRLFPMSVADFNIPGLARPDLASTLSRAKCTREYNVALANFKLDCLRLRKNNETYELQYRDNTGAYRVVYRNPSVANITQYILATQAQRR